VVIFAFLDQDTVPGTPLNPDAIPDPDPQHWEKHTDNVAIIQTPILRGIQQQQLLSLLIFLLECIKKCIFSLSYTLFDHND
jgi:hypothetical protein